MADATTYDELELEKLFHSPNDVHVLKIRGEAMVDDHLCDGDYVVIERRKKAANGEQAVVVIDGEESTLRRYYQEPDGKIRLQPANATMKPRYVSAHRCEVRGVVIGVLRSYQ